MTRVAFTVYGKPEPAGSKRAHAIRKGGELTGRVAVMDANPKAKGWQEAVKWAAVDAMLHRPHDQDVHVEDAATYNGDPLPLRGALVLNVTFYVKRPKAHFGTGRNAEVLKPSAPAYPTTKPDTTKLVRAIEDAMTGLVYRDDAQLVDQHAHKRYGLPERCEVVVEAL